MTAASGFSFVVCGNPRAPLVKYIVKSDLVDRLGPIPPSSRAHIIKTKIVVNVADIQNEEKNWLLDKWQVASGKLGLLGLAAIGIWHIKCAW